MSVIEAHKWIRLDLAARQRYMREFYATNLPDSVHELLGLVRAPHGYGVYASIGPNYQYAVFGRDSVAVAQDVLAVQPTLSKEIIFVLARLQGRGFNSLSEEEQGKIHHEYRSLQFNSHEVPKAARMVLERISVIWGGNEKQLQYYGSYDATPSFIRLVQLYCQHYGDDILNETFTDWSGVERTLRDAVRDAAAWLVGKLTASPWGLFEFKRLNPAGLVNQSWEDSEIAYLHTDGTTANSDEGVAAIELQGYAYDALYAAMQLVAVDEHEADAWRHLASQIRDHTLKELWMPQEKFFCMGLDRDAEGRARQIATLTANPGLLLDSSIFDHISRKEAWPYIEGIVRQLFTEEFLTVAGVRTRARKHAHLVSFADYHGSLVTWPKQTYRIACGLRRHGFYTLASLLEDTILHAVAQAGEGYEFFFVDRQGRAKYHYRQEHLDEPSYHDFGAANMPEPGQAWTISAILAIVDSRHNPEPILPVSEEVRQLENDILRHHFVRDIATQCGLKLN